MQVLQILVTTPVKMEFVSSLVLGIWHSLLTFIRRHRASTEAKPNFSKIILHKKQI